MALVVSLTTNSMLQQRANFWLTFSACVQKGFDVMCYVTQMGGDFVVSKNGKLVLVHCSQSSTDRPSVDTLLQAVRTA